MKLKIYLANREMTQKQFSDETGIPPSTLSKLIAKKNVSWKTIQILVKATEGTVTYQDLETITK